MVGCGDHDRVDVRPVQHGPEVLDPSHIGGKFWHARNALPQAGEPRVDLVVFSVQVRSINIAERDNLRIGMGKEGLEKLAAAVAHPDEAKTGLVACADHPGRGQRSKRHPRPRPPTAAFEKSRRLKPVDMAHAFLRPPAGRPCVMETRDASR